GADAQQVQVEHGLADPELDQAERRQQRGPAKQPGQDQRAGPAHRVPAVGLDAVGDADQDADQADREGDVAQPVDPGLGPDPDLAEAQVGPDGAADPDRHRDQEDQPPVHRGEHTAQDEPDEGPGDTGHLVDPHRRAALV